MVTVVRENENRSTLNRVLNSEMLRFVWIDKMPFVNITWCIRGEEPIIDLLLYILLTRCV